MTLQDNHQPPSPSTLHQHTRRTGQLSLNTWEGRLKGAFDRQALALAFKYQRDAQPRTTLTPVSPFTKLKSDPLLRRPESQPSLSLPSLLCPNPGCPTLGQLRIGTIQTAGLRLENVELPAYHR